MTKAPQKLKDIRDLEEEICKVEGSWLKNLVIGGKEYWNIEKMEPSRALPVPNPL
jgi:hypothetical protein